MSRVLSRIVTSLLACAPLAAIACHGGHDGPAPSPDHPSPHSSPDGETIHSLWVSAPDDVWVGAGDGGGLLRFDGTAWMQFDLPTHDTVVALYGFAPNDVWAATPHALFHWDGASWTPGAVPFSAGTNGGIEALWGAKPGEIYAVGSTERAGADASAESDVAMFRGDGFTMTPLTPPPPPGQISMIWGTGSNDVWIGGPDPASPFPSPKSPPLAHLFHYDGARWSSFSIGYFTAIVGRSPNDVYAFGSDHDATVVNHFDGVEWHWTLLPTGTQPFVDAWSTHEGDIWAITRDGKVFTVDGGGGIAPVPLSGAATGVAQDGDYMIRGVHGDLWMARRSGALYEQRGTDGFLR